MSDIPFDQRSPIHREAWFPPCFVRQNQLKINFFLRGDFRPLPNKNVFLLLFTAPLFKFVCINGTLFVLEHSILTLGALLTYSLANTSHIIISQASHFIGATIRIGRDILCLPYAGFFLILLNIILESQKLESRKTYYVAYWYPRLKQTDRPSAWHGHGLLDIFKFGSKISISWNL